MELRNILITVLACATVPAIIIACGSDNTSKFGDGNNNPVGFNDDSGFGNGDGNNTGPDLTLKDPFPTAACLPESGEIPAVPVVTGTEACPSDKNLKGCGCDKVGETAPCWTYLRKYRGLGLCHDGVTTCKPKNEIEGAWGDCENQVAPVEDAATGGARCSCFSLGKWEIDNTSPCLRLPTADTAYSYSTTYDVATKTNHYCGPEPAEPVAGPGVSPPGIWSTNRLTVDCIGSFHLCFKIKAGDIDNPKPDDCIMGQVCVDADIREAKVPTELPTLPTWNGAASDPTNACAHKWELETPETTSPGYGEMTVRGQTYYCDTIGNRDETEFVFNRVEYCPRVCRKSDPKYDQYKDTDTCKSCQLRGTGEFH